MEIEHSKVAHLKFKKQVQNYYFTWRIAQWAKNKSSWRQSWTLIDCLGVQIICSVLDFGSDHRWSKKQNFR